MIAFLSCDWGTSSFRLSLVDAENFGEIESVSTSQGILATYNSWQEQDNSDADARISFYLDVIKEQIAVIEQKLHRSLNGTPLLISGMASSSVGMKMLPYQGLPFSIDGIGMLTELIAGTQSFDHDVLLISGVKSDDDVMRGEETQLIGLLAAHTSSGSEKLCILPGTHSKHILVKDNSAISFNTYMTGEFFDLLSKKSILHAGIETGDDKFEGEIKIIFEKAVIEGSRSNLLNASFKVRTNSLFERISKKQNFYYLSGLLIGAELGEIALNDTIEIYLCCGSHLKPFYEAALEVLGKKNVYSFSSEAMAKAAMMGQYKIYENHINR